MINNASATLKWVAVLRLDSVGDAATEGDGVHGRTLAKPRTANCVLSISPSYTAADARLTSWLSCVRRRWWILNTVRGNSIITAVSRLRPC